MDIVPLKLPAKRKRLELSDAMKKEICICKCENPSWSHQKIAEVIRQQFELPVGPGRSTVCDILQEKEKWLSIENPSNQAIRHNTSRFPKLEEELSIWLSEQGTQGFPISDEIIIEQAKNIGNRLDIHGLEYSRGWLSNFKKRNEQRERITHSGIGNIGTVFEALAKFQVATKEGDLNSTSTVNEVSSRMTSEYKPYTEVQLGDLPELSDSFLSSELCVGAADVKVEIQNQAFDHKIFIVENSAYQQSSLSNSEVSSFNLGMDLMTKISNVALDAISRMTIFQR
ncbi:tc5 transposase DNA-binding domain-containing protein [Ditylenchus destructor]|uniref:Tc5 transposase DNA-binding domain-containing protein n=1 Tax=Ditylenchus destructor TaxID=166010 RepID=A0AAD4R8B4_9BILA|nr:tc5 transposase DNA-binding domain-containing protein [Ditylenchus destructor]